MAVRQDGNVTKPKQWASLPLSQWGDPVNFLFPVPDKSHASNAKARFTQNKGKYDAGSRNVVRRRLNRLLRKFDIDPLESDDSDIEESDEEEFTGTLVGQIQLDKSGKSQKGDILIPAARIATFSHPWYGKLYFDEDLFESFQDNFATGVLGTELAVDAEHRRNGMLRGMALGWMTDLEMEGEVFNIIADSTKTGRQYIGEEYRYASIEYAPNFVDQETGIEYGETLVAVAATNHPFVHRNKPIGQPSLEFEQTPSGVVYFVMPGLNGGAQNVLHFSKGGTTMPDELDFGETDGLITLSDGRQVSVDVVEQALDRSKTQSVQLKKSRIEAALEAAKGRNVPIVLVNIANQILEATDPEAPATINLKITEKDEPKKLNMFEVVCKLLEVAPGRGGKSPVTWSTQGEGPKTSKNGHNHYQSDDSDMTPEEAEELARKRREELYGEPEGATDDIEL